MYLSPNISEPPGSRFAVFSLEVINETPVNQPKLVWIDGIWGEFGRFCDGGGEMRHDPIILFERERSISIQLAQSLFRVSLSPDRLKRG